MKPYLFYLLTGYFRHLWPQTTNLSSRNMLLALAPEIPTRYNSCGSTLMDKQSYLRTR